jgi:phospholipid-binding lipoprotein MlaA
MLVPRARFPYGGSFVPRRGTVLLLLVCLLRGVGFAELRPADTEEEETLDAFPDPLERMNRATFAVNQKVDRWVFDPLTRAYTWAVPRPIRLGVRRIVGNLDAPVVFVNDLLQLEPIDATVTAGRFGVNTTVGLLGIFDVAERWGLRRHHSDFGQTLALCGVPSGPYLIVPIAGPTTARDGVGYLVDLLFHPATYLFAPATALFWTSVQEGGEGIVTREEHAEELHALEASAMDYYAALRSAYSQNRVATIWTRRAGRGPLALAKRAANELRRLAGTAPGGEVGELPPHQGDQPLETVAGEH